LCVFDAAKPLRSDTVGWVAWEIVEKQMFDKAGVDVQFEWFDYVASMEAFAAKQLDAVAMTNGGAHLTGATSGRSVMILINDFQQWQRCRS
jgi:NitT/TauT family transport system substrate-binding protein